MGENQCLIRVACARFWIRVRNYSARMDRGQIHVASNSRQIGLVREYVPKGSILNPVTRADLLSVR